MSQDQATPQIPMVMNVSFTVDEAQLILNKLNECNFKGFTEAGQAVTIFSKIKGTKPVPMQVGPPPIGAVKDDPNVVSPKKMIDKGNGETVKHFAAPATNNLGGQPAEVNTPIKEEEKLDKNDMPLKEDPVERDSRPGAPLMQMNPPKKPQTFTEDKETGDLVFDSEEDLEVGSEDVQEQESPVKHTSPVGTTIIEGGTLTDNDDVPPSDPDENESAFSVVNHSTSKIIEHPNPEDPANQTEDTPVEEEPVKNAANEYL